MTELGARHGYSSEAVRHTIRHRGSALVEAIIASHLGVTPQELWPDRYDSQGRPVDLRLLQHRSAVGQVPTSAKRRRPRRAAHKEAA